MERTPRASLLRLALLPLALSTALGAGGDGAPVPAGAPPAALAEEGAEVADGLLLLEPLPGARVDPPVRVEGWVRGTWLFEAVFEMRLLGPDGTEIASAPATAGGAWMTEDFVPFSGTLEVPAPLPPGPWTLVLREADPSGGEAGPVREARIEVRPAP